MITDQQLSQMCGRTIVGWAAPINTAMIIYQINTSARQSAFLAQILHESGRLQYLRELWGPTAAQKGYEFRADLGNTEPGDGFKYRGRGLIQITGRSNHQLCGFALGLDLIEHPELLEQPANAARSAGWFWYNHGLNELADAGDIEHITRKINGGLNGYADRQALYALVDDITTKG
jgi:putative chitinase